jgi:hypothetical protein
LKFEEVIREIFSRWNDVHPSFASKLVAAVNSPAGAKLSGVHLKNSEAPPLIPLKHIHPLRLGEFAGAAEAVALGVIAFGAGHRRREGFLQPRLGLRHVGLRRLVI